jgi:ABC-type glycerol-3-phosphate transport system substrate-binding protein
LGFKYCREAPPVQKISSLFLVSGGELYTPDGKYVVLASMKGIDALLYYQILHDSAGYVADQRGIEDAFMAEKVGFVLSGEWLLKRIIQEKPNFPLVTTLMPGPKFPGFSFLGGEFLAINAATKNKDSALVFVRFLSSPEQQLRFCKANFSANPSSKVAQKDAFFTSNIHLDLFIRQMHLAKHPPVDPDWVEIETDIEAAVEDALFGSKLIAQPLWRAQKKIVKLKSE